LPVSRQSVSRAIARLHLRWKRPRHRLGRRPATWRQAKGGSNGACEDGHGPSSSCLTRPSSRKPHHSTTATGGKGSMPNVSSMAFGAVAKYIFRMFVAVILAYNKASCALHERTGYFWSGETDAYMRCGPRLVLAAPPCGWGAGGLGRSEAERIAVIRNQYQALRRVMEEKVRRRWAACAARALGWGGSTAVAAAPGRSRPTMRAGLAEVHGGASRSTEDHQPARHKVRRGGGGRRRVTAGDRPLLTDFHAWLASSTRGDPPSPVRWTRQSTRHLADARGQPGHPVSHHPGARVLEERSESRQGNRQTQEGRTQRDRDAPFEPMNKQVRAFQKRGPPVVSVATKQKAWLGDCKKAGHAWPPTGHPVEVRTQDFVDQQRGKGIP